MPPFVPNVKFAASLGPNKVSSKAQSVSILSQYLFLKTIPKFPKVPPLSTSFCPQAQIAPILFPGPKKVSSKAPPSPKKGMDELTDDDEDDELMDFEDSPRPGDRDSSSSTGAKGEADKDKGSREPSISEGSRDSSISRDTSR